MMAHFRRPPESFSPSRTLAIVGSEFVDDHTVSWKSPSLCVMHITCRANKFQCLLVLSVSGDFCTQRKFEYLLTMPYSLKNTIK